MNGIDLHCEISDYISPNFLQTQTKVLGERRKLHHPTVQLHPKIKSFSVDVVISRRIKIGSL